jgi:hypothetical protein
MQMPEQGMHRRCPGPENATDGVTDPHRATVVSTGETLSFNHRAIPALR